MTWAWQLVISDYDNCHVTEPWPINVNAAHHMTTEHVILYMTPVRTDKK